jgi:exosortase D (VPLPA-CTERM-specific)
MATLHVPATDRSSRGLSSSQWAWIVTLGVLTVLAALLYAENLRFLVGYFRQPEYSHGYLIPAITLFFLWQRRHAILAERTTGSSWGIALAVLAMLVFIAGLMAFMVRLAAISFVIFLLAAGYASLGNRAMRRVLLPVLFLLVALPLPGIVFVWLSTDLQLISSHLGGWMLQTVGVSVFVGGNIIDLGVYQLQVAEACSGLRYLLPLLAFAVLCAWLMRAPWWMRGLMVLSAVPLTVVLNSVRIAMTGLFVEYGSIHLAEGFMHLFEGWVVFLVALSVLFAEMWFLCRLSGKRVGVLDVLDFDRINGPAAVPSTVKPARPPAALFVVIGLVVATLLVQTQIQDRTQYLPARPGLATLPLALAGWQGTPQSLDPRTERTLGATDYLLADYGNGRGDHVNFWVAYYEEQIRNTAIHSPKECLPGAGWEYVDLSVVDAPIDPGVGAPFQLNRGLIAKGSEQMVMYYWLDMRGRKLTNEIWMKMTNLYDSIVEGRSDGALVRLITQVEVGETVADAERRLASFLNSMYPHLEPHVGR